MRSLKLPRGRARRSADRPVPSARAARSRAPASPVDAVFKLIYELAAIAGELIAIPLRLWMRAAEVAGRVVLGAARMAWPRLLAVWRAAKAAVGILARTITPPRMAAVVALAAAAALAGSQFVNYRAVEVGAPEYQSVQDVAAAPEVATRDPRDAHGAWLLAIAAVAVATVLVSYGRRWRLARLLTVLGAAAIAVVVLHDHDVGLQAGSAGNAYEGAKAVLLDGYRAELIAAAVLAVTGPLLALHLGHEMARRSTETKSPQRRAATRAARRGNPPAVGTTG